MAGTEFVADMQQGRHRQHGILATFRQHGAAIACRPFLGDEVGRQPPLAKARVIQHGREEVDVMADAGDPGLVQRCRQGRNRLVAILAEAAQLGDHRIVEHADLAAFHDAGVVADDIRLRRRAPAHQAARRGQETTQRVFGIDAGLDGPAAQLHLRLRDGQLFICCNADHLLDQVDAGDQLGDRMLHLQAGIHLQEIEAAVRADDELHRAGTVVIHRLGQGDGLLAHRLARLLVEERARRFFDHFLVPALDRAFAFAQIDHVAVLVA